MPSVSTQTCSSDNEHLVISSHTQLPDAQSAPQFYLPLPWNYEKTRQYWWYGYNVGHDWLIQYAKQRDEHPEPNDSDLTLLLYARDSLSSYTGVKALAMGTAIRDESVPQDAALSFDGHVSILAICSSRRESYYNRPTQAQVDKLTQILGCEPRWWIDERNPLQYGPVDPMKLSTSSNQVESSEGLAVSSNLESGHHRISVSRPANYQTISRFYWYGYNIGHDWLMEYAQKHLRPERSAKVRPIQQLSYARNRLRRKTKISTLALSIARRDETTPPNPALTTLGNICILSIFTAGGSSWRNRPTQAQVDRLTKIVGCQPRWWVDGETMESYYQ